MKKHFLYFFIVAIASISIFTGCGNEDKAAYETDLAAYATFKTTIASLDNSDFAAYVAGISQAVEDFECSTTECIQLKGKFRKMAGLLESYQVSLDSDAMDDSAYEDLDSRMEELTTAAQEDADALRAAAGEAGVDKKYIRSIK